MHSTCAHANEVCVGSFDTIIRDNLYADYGDLMDRADWWPVFIKIWILISVQSEACMGEGVALSRGGGA